MIECIHLHPDIFLDSFSGTLEDLLQLFERRSNAGFVVENMTLLDSSVPLAKEELTMLRQHLVSFLVTSGVSTDLNDELEKGKCLLINLKITEFPLTRRC